MSTATLPQGILVPAGTDRYQENNLFIWGLIPLATKISTQDSGGSIYLFQHANMRQGGPPRHVHFHQDEWFFILQGEFAFEIGEEKYRLHAGDSLFAPRMIPHAWAYVGKERGNILTAVTPAGTFETFLRDTARLPAVPPPEEVAKAFAAHDMQVVGPPLPVD
jgi:mannose-6-phosphate isomerase-like protein (cupin superfamily)